MNSFEVKNKDRNPEETIQILEKFFLDRGYELHPGIIYESDIGTWTSSYTIYLEGDYILNSNGKGLTKNYAIASGLAELYERFCNKMPFLLNPYTSKRYFLEQKRIKNYYWDSNEKQISFEEQYSREYFEPLKNLFPKEEMQEYLNHYCPCGLFEIPFKNCFNNLPDKYFNVAILHKLYTSTGMAAGNTIEEALNQGISELYERYVSEKFYKEIQDIYYCVDYNKLKNQKLKQLCKNLEKDFKIFIFDLSYNFKVPVILTVGIDRKNYRIITSLGSFPVFDIALERTITELYQGMYSHKLDNTPLQTPWNDSLWYTPQVKHAGSYVWCPIFPEIIFDRIKYIDEPNQIYIPNGDNTEINNYYKNLSNSLNFNFYYYENSLIEEVKSIHIYSDNLYPLSGRMQYLKDFVTDEQKKIYLLYYQTFHYFINSIFENNFDYNDFFTMFLKVGDKAESYDNFIDFANIMFQSDSISLYPSQDHKDKNISIIWKIYRGENPQDILDYAQLSYFYKYIKKYFTLLKYCSNKTYTNNDIKKIFRLFNDDEITDEEINNSSKIEYLIIKMFIEPLYNEYHSQKFEHFILSLIK